MAGVIGVWWKNPGLWQFLIIGFFFFFFIYENSKFASFQSDEGLYMHFKTQGLEVNPSTHTHTHTTEPPSTTVDTNQVGSMFSRRSCKNSDPTIWVRVTAVIKSPDRTGRPSPSLLSANFDEPVWIRASVSCSRLTGGSSSAAVAHLLQVSDGLESEWALIPVHVSSPSLQTSLPVLFWHQPGISFPSKQQIYLDIFSFPRQSLVAVELLVQDHLLLSAPSFWCSVSTSASCLEEARELKCF